MPSRRFYSASTSNGSYRIPDWLTMTLYGRLSLVVVDDDPEVRKALNRLLRSLGHDVRLFGSAEEFDTDNVMADCLIVDVRLPGLNGPELRDRIRGRGLATPIVFISGDSGPSAREVTVSGAPCLAKPFDDIELIAAITTAMTAARMGGEPL